jgi:hypothetical protein
MRIIALLLAAGLLGGCESWKTSARINPHPVAIYPGGIPDGAPGADRLGNTQCPLTNGLYDTNRGSVNLDCFRFPGELEGPTAYQLASAVGDQGRAYRNRLMSVLITHADNTCVLEKGRLFATQASANFALSFLTSALSGASTVVGGETASDILSALATQTNATRSNINENFYRNQITQAINSAIDRERQRLITQIVASRGLDAAAFDVDQMIALVNSYHHACSFERGLQLLLDASLDSSGANAALEERSRESAIAELQRHIAELRRTLTGNLTDTARADVQTQLAEALARLHGLRMAGSQRMVTDPTPQDSAPPAETAGPGG